MNEQYVMQVGQGIYMENVNSMIYQGCYRLRNFNHDLADRFLPTYQCFFLHYLPTIFFGRMFIFILGFYALTL